MFPIPCRVPLCLLLVLLPLTLAAEQPAVPDAQAALDQILEDAWQFELRTDPLFATRVGEHRYNDRLPDTSPGELRRQAEFRQTLLTRLEAVPIERLPRSAQINHAILRRTLSDAAKFQEFSSHLMPLTNRWGFHIAFPELPQRVPLGTLRDYENYLARLRDFPRYADEQMAWLAEGMRQGRVLPAAVMEGYLETIRPHIVDEPEQSLLFAPLRRFPDRIGADEQERLREAGRRAVAEQIVPSYQRFLEFMRDEYLPACRPTTAIADLPDGREYYRFLVRHFTTLDVTPEEVHAIGQAEVVRIRGEMRDVIRRAGFEGGQAEFVKFLREDPRFYATSAEQLQKEVAWILKRMDGRLPELFKTLPRTPYGLRVVPAYIAPKTTSAYYSQPAGDGSQAGFYYINTFNLKSRPLYEMEALSLHEAVPGHHLQLALQQELRDLPPMRRFTEFTAFVEGWALYAESLGREVGFYEDPYSDFGRLSFEMWRACRLVVDTGLHYLGWSRQRAIDFMAEHTALSLHNIEAEVDRYISWPGQALAYKMGELKIRQLRTDAEQKLGAAFDLREFHDVVLGSGSVPLDLLEENVRALMP
ncbi:MAG: DUF885 domain-containing protein [Pirellulaceae bacterium]|nr:DUF885 domain-containing protein [Pirellulaceae bacterium]